MEIPAESALHFLLGEWIGEGGGGPGEGSGAFRFAPDLQGKVLVRTNYAEYPATAERPAFRHDDLMVVHTDPLTDRLRAMFFDSEGHVIAYTVEESRDPLIVRFISDAIPGSPRYQLTYTTTGPDTLDLTFAIAPPDAPETFAIYISASARRRSHAGF
jgi:hypothetical protein